MPPISYQSGLSQKVPLSPSGWPKDECQYRSRKRKTQKLTNRTKLTHTSIYTLLLVFLEKCFHLCLRSKLGGTEKFDQKTDSAIILPGLKIPVKKTWGRMHENITGLQEGQIFAGNGREDQKGTLKMRNKISQWFANTDNVCSQAKPTYRNKTKEYHSPREWGREQR